MIKLSLIILFSIPSIKLTFAPREEGVLLSYPFKNGNYFVIQGGWFPFNNAHFFLSEKVNDQSTVYGVDIVKLNKHGSYSKKLSHKPQELEEYEIFGDTIYSPCDGIVHDTENSMKDHGLLKSPLDATDKGNYIRINHNNLIVALGHLKQSSILVHQGDSVKVGEPLGLVGHSGYSNFPHLHIHTFYRQATINKVGDTLRQLMPVPMYFEKRFLRRNDLIILTN